MIQAAKILLALSFVLWTRGLWSGPAESWRPVRSFAFFSQCQQVALRSAEVDKHRYPFGSRENIVNLSASASRTDLGATASIYWQTAEQRSRLADAKKQYPGLIGGTGFGEGITVEYECWHSDVDLNKIRR